MTEQRKPQILSEYVSATHGAKYYAIYPGSTSPLVCTDLHACERVDQGLQPQLHGCTTCTSTATTATAIATAANNN